MGGGTDGTLYKTDSDGNLNVFNVEHDNDERWLNTNHGNPDNFWNGNNVWVFAFRELLHFSPRLWGEFCLFNCPFQPPTILPISSILRDRAIYFLLFKELVSQRTISNTFSASIFFNAKLIYGNFSFLLEKLATARASIILIKKVSMRCPSEYLCVLGRV